MCGIVGYIGDRRAAEILVTGLKRLEYRGYDSAGVAIVNGELDNAFCAVRPPGHHAEEDFAAGFCIFNNMDREIH